MNNGPVHRKLVHRGRPPMRAPTRAALTAAVLALVALTILAVPAAAGTAVPFNGSVQGAETATPIDATHLSVIRENTGNATQLGRFTAEEHFVVDLTTLSATGTEVFTAANGDTVTADTFGQATPIPGTPNLALEEFVTITGGTGRFAGATGSSTGERVLDGATGLSAGSFEGTISSPGASKH
jgi:hypothetical protein